MIFTRRIGKVLRGRATPFQIVLAGTLGGMLAFQPGFAHAPGLLVTLIALLVVLNGSLPFALLVWAPAKLLSFALMSVSFAIGRFLIDGPTQPVWRVLVNAPVLAWFGFDNYVASGGLVLGGAIGCAAGLVVARMLIGVRRKLATLEEGSERYQTMMKKPWVRALLFVFVGGGRGKKTWGELAAQRVGNPIRITGVIVAVLLVAGGWLAQKRLASPVLTRGLRDGLQRWNGATVDLGRAELALDESRVSIADLAIADPDELGRDLFRTSLLEADASMEDFLRKRVHIERLVARAASSGLPRAEPGERWTPPGEVVPPPESAPGEKTIEEWLADYEKWKERLRKAREWMEKVSRREDGGDPPAEEDEDESLRERLERIARERGWAAVHASHLIEDAPELLVSETSVEELTIASFPDEVFDVRAWNVSTHPSLAPASPRFELASKSGRIRVAVDMNASSPRADAPGLALAWKEIPAATIARELVAGGGKPLLEGGTVDLALEGGWSEGRVGWIDLPLVATVKQSTLHLGDLGSAPIESMRVAIHLRGPLDALRVRIDADELADALREAGAAELERRVRGKVDELEQEARDRLEEERKKLEDKAKNEAREGLEERAGEKAKELFDGVLGGKKKKDGG